MPSEKEETGVFIIHGFRSDSSSTAQLARTLSAKYKVFPVDLPITFESLDKCTLNLISVVVEAIEKYRLKRINFICHSTGGIIARLALQFKEISEKTVACIFVSTPNKGTNLAVLAREVFPNLSRIYKPIIQLTPSYVQNLKLHTPSHVFFAGIAGVKPWGKTNSFFSGANDGVVEVSSVFIEEMVDFVRVPYDHFEIMGSFLTARLAFEFLENFSFPKNIK